jgi:hypothetical protein
VLQLDPILSKEARRKSDTGIANPCLRKLVNDIASPGYGRGKISSTTALHPARPSYDIGKERDSGGRVDGSSDDTHDLEVTLINSTPFLLFLIQLQERR